MWIEWRIQSHNGIEDNPGIEFGIPTSIWTIVLFCCNKVWGYSCLDDEGLGWWVLEDEKGMVFVQQFESFLSS